MTARDIVPGCVLDLAAGSFRVDWTKPTFGGIECHNVAEDRKPRKVRRVLWFHPANPVTVLRRVKPKRPEAVSRLAGIRAIGGQGSSRINPVASEARAER